MMQRAIGMLTMCLKLSVFFQIPCATCGRDVPVCLTQDDDDNDDNNHNNNDDDDDDDNDDNYVMLPITHTYIHIRTYPKCTSPTDTHHTPT